MKLGVFDSGIGGEAIAAALRADFPEAEIITVNDRANLPYGDKSSDQIIVLTNAAIQPLLLAKCDVIVIACNSATTAAITWLRDTYPDQLFVGIEPMVKPAAKATRSGTIAVCATPVTLSSDSYRRLVDTHARHLNVIEPDCSDWAEMIENNTVNEAAITHTIEDVIKRGADVIVLGCTHYHWIKQLIKSITQGRATILEPSTAIGRRIHQLLD